MDEFSNFLGALSPVMRWLMMKKDAELPWVTRILRWALLAFGVAYGLLLLIEKAKEIF